MVEQIVFFIFTAITLLGALGTVTQRNLFRAALSLMAALVGVAGLFGLLEAGFLAMMQVLVYAGGIAILIVFAVMMTRRVMNPDEPQSNSQAAGAAVLALAVLLVLVLVLWPDPIKIPEMSTPEINFRGRILQLHINEIELGDVQWPEQEADVDSDNLTNLGEALVDSEGYVVPFEVASVLLLVAMIGGVYIAFPPRKATPEPAPEPGAEE
jgi:NADH-quinone oxidoreductase subunit J